MSEVHVKSSENERCWIVVGECMGFRGYMEDAVAWKEVNISPSRVSSLRGGNFGSKSDLQDGIFTIIHDDKRGEKLMGEVDDENDHFRKSVGSKFGSSEMLKEEDRSTEYEQKQLEELIVPTSACLFGLFDGHGGSQCSKYLSTVLIDVCSEMIEKSVLKYMENCEEDADEVVVPINLDLFTQAFTYVDIVYWVENGMKQFKTEGVSRDTVRSYLLEMDDDLIKYFPKTHRKLNIDQVYPDTVLLSQKKCFHAVKDAIQNMLDDQVIFLKDSVNCDMPGSTGCTLFCFWEDPTYQSKWRTIIEKGTKHSEILKPTVDTPCVLFVCGNVGDSRAIVYDSESKGNFLLSPFSQIDEHFLKKMGNSSIVQLSQDQRPTSDSDNHFVSTDFQQQEKTRIVNAGGEISTGRVCGTLSVSRAFGDFEYKCNDELSYEEQIITAVPQWSVFELPLSSLSPTNPSFALLASDGLFDEMTNVEVTTFILDYLKKLDKIEVVNLEQLVKNLIMHAIYDRECCDNVSLVLIILKPQQ